MNVKQAKWLPFSLLLLLLLVLTAAALPTLASSGSPQRLAPGWQELTPSVVPPARNDHAMAYDSARGLAVMFGGTDGFTVFSDVWEWDSATFTWTEFQPTNVPPPRYGHAMVYDEARGVTILFGGNGGSGIFYNDLWEYNGEGWTEVVTADAPEGRWLHAMAYDPDRQVTVLHSGLQTSSAGAYGDSWEYNGVNWVEQDIVNPPEPYRYGEGLAYARQQDVMVLFGGTASGGIDYDQTWQRVGSGDWQQVFPTQSPAPRARMGMTYYDRLKRSFIFGGLNGGYHSDTAIYNGQTWLSNNFNPGPAGRCCLAMVYDTRRKAVFLFGGAVGGLEQNDVWYFR